MIIKYSSDLDRESMAQCITRYMGALPDFKPYKPNEHDDSFWTVDAGNDWKIKFYDDKPKEVEIIHRYNNQEAITALSTWIAYRTSGRV